jgi:hypothetical protein
MSKPSKHFIPSPYDVVTQYERTFIREWNNTTSQAVGEVLKYIAHATAEEIKEDVEKSQDDELNKAHVDGDIHPKHPNWYWNSTVNHGRGDWRVRRTTEEKK